jgi:hypothetical protein
MTFIWGGITGVLLFNILNFSIPITPKYPEDHNFAADRI